ncbi:MAG: response regulator transcription factor, partial [Acidobacteriota bacterium]
VQKAFEAGACGYLTKTATAEEMERAIYEVLAGRFYVSPEVARAAVLSAAYSRKSQPTAAGETLTAREHDVLRLLAEGLSNDQIAQRLSVAVTTVRTHLGKLYGKLRLTRRVELALYAAQIGGTTQDPDPGYDRDEIAS